MECTHQDQPTRISNAIIFHLTCFRGLLDIICKFVSAYALTAMCECYYGLYECLIHVIPASSCLGMACVLEGTLSFVDGSTSTLLLKAWREEGTDSSLLFALTHILPLASYEERSHQTKACYRYRGFLHDFRLLAIKLAWPPIGRLLPTRPRQGV